MFETELNYFISHQDELVASHQGKVLVIRGEEVIGIYGTIMQAYVEAQKQFPLGTFMLQPCESGLEAYTVTISNQELFTV